LEERKVKKGGARQFCMAFSGGVSECYVQHSQICVVKVIYIYSERETDLCTFLAGRFFIAIAIAIAFAFAD
jgi:hypothetical protein